MNTPSPEEIYTAKQMRDALAGIRKASGKSLADLVEESEALQGKPARIGARTIKLVPLTKPNISGFTGASRVQLPGDAVLATFLLACKVPGGHLGAWLEAVERARSSRDGEMAPDPALPRLPDHFVPRPTERRRVLDQLRELARRGRGGTVGLASTAALHGTGGFGKTTLAIDVCRQDEVRALFPDGVVWIEIGQEPVLTALLADIAATVSGRPRVRFGSVDAAAAALSEALADRRVLLVLDNVWAFRDLEPFLRGGPRCVRLVTSRLADVLPAGTPVLSVDRMEPELAVELLRRGVPNATSAVLYPLYERSQRWPVVLGILNGVLRARTLRVNTMPLTQVVAELVRRLDAGGVSAVDDLAGSQQRTVREVLAIGMDELQSAPDGALLHERFLSLAAFPPDQLIGFDELAELWECDGIESRSVCDRLADRSLLGSTESWGVRLHDVIRDHVLHDHRPIVRSWTERQLEALRGHCIDGRWDRLAPTYDAALDQLSYLMVATDREEELRTLLFDLRFMVRRIRQGGTAGFLSDLGACESSRGRDPELRALERIIGLEGHLALRADVDRSAPGGVESVAATLWSRLVGDPAVSGLVTHRDESLLEAPVALHPMPDRPDARLVHVYDGHTDRVVAVSWRADGDRLATATADGVVHIWDVRGSRQRVVRFEAAVSALAWSPDHLHLAVLTGEYGLCLIEPIHGDVTTVGFASGGAVEAEDVARGMPVAELTCLAWMPHGLAIGRSDGDVVLWEIGEDRVTRAISHPGSAVRAMQWSDILSGLVAVHADGVFTVLHELSADGGRERVTAQTGLNVPRALAVRAGGTEIVIGAAQNELLMLDAAVPEAAAISTPTTGWTTSVGWSADGAWIAAGLQDGAVALWSETGSEPGPAGYVDVLLDDETPQRRGWSERFANQQRIDYHGQRVAAVSWHPLQPQLAVAAQKDLRVYDLQRDAEHEPRHGVNCLCRHPNRDLFAAGGMDGEIILTKAADLAWRRTVEVFTSPVRSIAFSPDGDRLAVLADDGRLLLWDTRALLEDDAAIDGSVSSISCPVDQPGAVAWTPDGAALAIGGNKLVVLLDSTTLGELRRFPVADLVNGLARPGRPMDRHGDQRLRDRRARPERPARTGADRPFEQRGRRTLARRRTTRVRRL